MLIKKDFAGHTIHYYINDNDFMLNYTLYEYDESTGRYYFLDNSISLTSKAGREGGLVRRRVSKADYERALSECKALLATAEEETNAPRYELIQTAMADKLALIGRMRDATPALVEATFLPEISGADMVADFDGKLRQQISDPHYRTDQQTAVHELYGYKVALENFGLLDSEECFVTPNHFGSVECNRSEEVIRDAKKPRNRRFYADEYEATEFGIFPEKAAPYDNDEPSATMELDGATYIGGDLYIVPLQIFKTENSHFLKLVFLVTDLYFNWTGSFAEIGGNNIRTAPMTPDGKLFFYTGSNSGKPLIDLAPRPQKKHRTQPESTPKDWEAARRYLEERRELDSHNLLCYSANYGMDSPKDGYAEEWAKSKRACEIVDDLIQLVENAKRPPTKKVAPCKKCPLQEKDAENLKNFLQETSDYGSANFPDHISQ